MEGNHAAGGHLPLQAQARCCRWLHTMLHTTLSPTDRPATPPCPLQANMHGTEPGGRQLLLTLAEWLCASYPKDATAQRIIDGMHLYL